LPIPVAGYQYTPTLPSAESVFRNTDKVFQAFMRRDIEDFPITNLELVARGNTRTAEYPTTAEMEKWEDASFAQDGRTRRQRYQRDPLDDEAIRAFSARGVGPLQEVTRLLSGRSGSGLFSVTGMAISQRISISNANRIVNTVGRETSRVIADNPQLTPVQQRQVRLILGALANLAAVRSEVYDMSMLNPSAPRGQGDFSGKVGAPLGRIAKEVTRRAQLLTRALNSVLGERNTAVMPGRDTTGGRVYTTVISGLGTASYNSALKMARENEPRVNEVRAALANVAERL
jgi:hypothetical protein